VWYSHVVSNNQTEIKMTTAQSQAIFFILTALRASCAMDPTAEVVEIHSDKSTVVVFHEGGAETEFTIGTGGAFYDVNGKVDKWAAAKRVRNTIDPGWL
jgi:poly(3-hydroxybutyrate) depolymerase